MCIRDRSKVGLNEHLKEKHALEPISSEAEGASDEDEVEPKEKDEDKKEGEETAKEDDAILVEEDDDFPSPRTKKEKKLAAKKTKLGIKSSGVQMSSPFSIHAPVPDLQKQRKITSSFASISKKPSTTIPNAMAVPKIFSSMGE